MGITVRQIDKLGSNDENIVNYILEVAEALNNVYGRTYDYGDFPIFYVLKNEKVFMAFDGDKPIGVLFATLRLNTWDPKIKVLRMETLYTKSPRATASLLRYFIDFGRQHANHVVMSIGLKTNLKPESLEKLGFKELETLYRLEV